MRRHLPIIAIIPALIVGNTSVSVAGPGYYDNGALMCGAMSVAIAGAVFA